jgi:hypothetical protein
MVGKYVNIVVAEEASRACCIALWVQTAIWWSFVADNSNDATQAAELMCEMNVMDECGDVEQEPGSIPGEISVLGLAGSCMVLVFDLWRKPLALVVPACMSRPKRAKRVCRSVTPVSGKIGVALGKPRRSSWSGWVEDEATQYIS